LEELEFRDIGGSRSQLFLRFSRDTAYETPLSRLSDGQKCFFIAAVLSVFAEKELVPFCFWDEPDNFLSLSEGSAIHSASTSAEAPHANDPGLPSSGNHPVLSKRFHSCSQTRFSNGEDNG